MRRDARRARVARGTHHELRGIADRGGGDGLADGTRRLFPEGGRNGGQRGPGSCRGARTRSVNAERTSNQRRKVTKTRVGLRDRAGARVRWTFGTSRRGGISRAPCIIARSRPSENAAASWSSVEATRRARGAAKHFSPDSKKCVRVGSRAAKLERRKRGAETHLSVRTRTAGDATGGGRGDRGGSGHGSRHRTRSSCGPEGSRGTKSMAKTRGRLRRDISSFE